MNNSLLERREKALQLTKERLRGQKIETHDLVMLICLECDFSFEYALKIVIQMLEQGSITTNLWGLLQLPDEEDDSPINKT
ncbi:MAG TPA: hypothetical protein VF209_02545 [Patescibacteria group bacterium]